MARRTRHALTPLGAAECIDGTKPKNGWRLGRGYAKLDLVFATGTGTPINRRNLVQRHLKPLLRKAGLPDTLRLYDSRH